MNELPMFDPFLNSLEEGVLFLDKDRTIISANRAAAEMLGHDKSNLTGKLCPHVFTGTACARACDMHGSCALTPDNEEYFGPQDIVLQRPDDPPIYLRMWAIYLPQEDARPLHAAIILRDRSHEVALEQIISKRLQLGRMVGHGPTMQKLYTQILRVASSSATVLITGESGTGKELVARALHENSDRSKKPFVAVNCAALPEHLLESELFGYARGAFTGATSVKIGRFEAAEGGTLLLDELGDIPPGIQVKLLRVLQEHEIVRLGENHTRKINVRVIAATHRDLATMVKNGEFREDLYYRLRVIPLHVPPLRERKEDIAVIADKLLHELGVQYRRDGIKLDPAALEALEAYEWPGNVRQLINALEYAVVHADGLVIHPRHLPPETKPEAQPIKMPSFRPAAQPLVRTYYRPPQRGESEHELIMRTLAETGGNKTEAARRLGMSRTSLWKRLKQEGL